jgi:hypothetical protein
VAVVALAAACGSSTAATSTSNAGASCGPAAARTLAASSGARVYVQSGAVYACTPRSARRYRLGSAGRCIGGARVGPAAAAGPVVAYAVTRCGVDTGSATVVVRLLSDGSQLLDHPALTAAPGPESFQSVGSIVVNRGGAAAWIATSNSILSHRRITQVVEATRAGVRALASGAGIDVRSLRLHGSTLSWSAGGASHSARLG